MVVGTTDVGRTGAPTVAVEVNSGQTSLPQARSVGQQPPPRDAGQERKPEEHPSVLVMLDVLSIVVVVMVGLCALGLAGTADVVGGEATTTVEGEGEEDTTVVVVESDVDNDDRVREGVGVTMRVAVELSRQPPFTQA